MQNNNREPLFPASINGDLEKMDRNRKTFRTADGKYDPAAWLDFATQFNAYMGHARRPFTPITGKHFKL